MPPVCDDLQAQADLELLSLPQSLSAAALCCPCCKYWGMSGGGLGQVRGDFASPLTMMYIPKLMEIIQIHSRITQEKSGVKLPV